MAYLKNYQTEGGQRRVRAIVKHRGWQYAVKTFPTKRDAKLWSTRIEAELRESIAINERPAQRITVAELAHAYLDHYYPKLMEERKLGAGKSSKVNLMKCPSRPHQVEWRVQRIGTRVITEVRSDEVDAILDK